MPRDADSGRIYTISNVAPALLAHALPSGTGENLSSAFREGQLKDSARLAASADAEDDAGS
jgi:hypothetical protein